MALLSVSFCTDEGAHLKLRALGGVHLLFVADLVVLVVGLVALPGALAALGPCRVQDELLGQVLLAARVRPRFCTGEAVTHSRLQPTLAPRLSQAMISASRKD